MKNKKVVAVAIAVLTTAAAAGMIALGGDKNNSADGMNNTEISQTENNPATQENSSQPAAVANQASTIEVGIEDYAYKPAAIRVKAGTTVRWTNRDSVEHNVVADQKSSDAPLSELLAKGKSYSFTFNKVGTYSYHCAPHPYMKGTVIVE